MTGKLKAAIVGCGSISESGYFPFVSKTFDLVATADAIPERARETARLWGAKRSYDGMESLLKGEKGLDAVFILTAMSSHIELVQQAIDAGVNFLVQKPFTTDLQAGLAAVRSARAKGVIGLVEPSRFNSPSSIKAKEILEEGHIGRPLYVRAIREREFIPQWGGLNFYEREGGGAMFDLGVYHISEMCMMLGPAEAVTGMSSVSVPERYRYGDEVYTNYLKGLQPGYRSSHHDAAVLATIPTESEAYDNTMTVIRWPGDCLGVLVCNAVSFVAPPPNARLTICGEKGTILIGPPGTTSELSVATLLKDSPYYCEAPAPSKSSGVGRVGTTWYHFPANALKRTRYTQESTEELYRCIQQKKDPHATIEWGMHVAEIMIGARVSSETGREQKLHTTFKKWSPNN
jgi:predicted dehydrogenase